MKTKPVETKTKDLTNRQLIARFGRSMKTAEECRKEMKLRGMKVRS